MTESLVLPYGDHPDQYVQCRLAQDAQRGTAVLIHGGYWREKYTADLMDPLIESFARHGWATVNVEYRRGPQASWPAPLDDVRAACHTAVEWVASTTAPGPMIGVGHSVGGQLVLLAASLLDGVVALAPVTDAARVYTDGLGDGAAQEYFRATPSDEPATYTAASPVQQLPGRTATLLVHGGDDTRVPLGHSLDYLKAAHEGGDPVSAYFPHRLSHLDAINPDSDHWEGVFNWMSYRTRS